MSLQPICQWHLWVLTQVRVVGLEGLLIAHAHASFSHRSTLQGLVIGKAWIQGRLDMMSAMLVIDLTSKIDESYNILTVGHTWTILC